MRSERRAAVDRRPPLTTGRPTGTAVLLVVLLALVTITSRGLESQGGGATGRPAPLRLFVATDLHYLAPELTDGGKAFQTFTASADGRQLDSIDQIVEAFARDVTRLKPDVLVLSGDLTTNGERLSHERLAAKLKRIEQAAGTRVFVIPGNHDVLNPWARGFKDESQYRTDSITPDEFKTIYGDFGYGEAVSSDPSTLSYLVAPSEDTWLLMLDTNTYRINQLLGRPATEGKITTKTLEWIRQCCERAKERHARIITVMHHNLVDHSELLRNGYTIANSADIAGVFGPLGLNVVLSGHVHIQDIKRVGTVEAPIYDIATSALSIYPQQYGIVEVAPSGEMAYSTAKVDVEAWARETGSTDQRLRTFTTSSRHLFIAASAEKTYAALTKAGTSAEDSKLMADTMGALNANYFAGTASGGNDAIIQSRGYKLWEAAPETTRMKKYVLSMIPKTAADHTRVTIPAPAGESK